jgi:mannose/fructose/N-acetylgalactosamine-specific phosphotransferase system component IID
VTLGIIKLSVGSATGPIIWFLAILVTPFGMPSFRRWYLSKFSLKKGESLCRKLSLLAVPERLVA